MLAGWLFPPDFETLIDRRDVSTDEGHAYNRVIRSAWWPLFLIETDDRQTPRRARLALSEDSHPLGPAHSPELEIRETGSGAFSFWRGILFFSASDNSDPRQNGRRYLASGPTVLSATALKIALLLNAVFLFALVSRWRLRGRSGRDQLGVLRTALVQPFDRETESRPTAMGAQTWLALACGAAAMWGLLFVLPPSWRPDPVRLEWTLIVLAGAAMLAVLWLPERPAATTGRRAAWLCLPVLGLLLFAVPLLEAWSSGRSNGLFLGGLLPYSDATSYYIAGLRLLNDGTLDPWNMRRPINAALHALRLFLTGADLQLSLALTGATAAVVALAAAREIARSLGLIAAALFFLLTYGFIRDYVPTTLTSMHGLTFALAALAVLWRSAIDRSPLLFAVGLLLLTLGLNARAGAFFVLPAILLWGTLYLDRDRLISPRCLIYGLLGLAGGFLIPALFSALWGEGSNMSHANFAYTLYGMAVGGKGWTQIYQDHPEVFRVAHEGTQARAVYRLAFDLILADPRPFLTFYLSQLPEFWRYALLMSEKLLELGRGLHQGMLLLGVVCLAVNWRRPAAGLLLFALAGMAASAPFLMKDGGERVFASTVVLLFVIHAVAVGFIARLLAAQMGAKSTESAEGAERHRRGVAILASAALAVALIGPLAAVSLHPRLAVVGAACPEGFARMVTRPGATATSLSILPDGILRTTAVPAIRHSDFTGAPRLSDVEFASAILPAAPPFRVMLLYDLAWRDGGGAAVKWAVVKGGLEIPAGRRPVVLCGRPDPSPELAGWANVFFHVESVAPLSDRP